MIASPNGPILLVIIVAAVTGADVRADQGLGSTKAIMAVEPTTSDKTEAENQLQINQFVLAYTPLGPKRVEKTVYPGENLFIHAEIDGVSRNGDGEKEASVEIQIVDSTGRIVASRTQSWKGKPKHDRAVRINVGIAFPSDTEPGVYALRLKISDLHAKTWKAAVKQLEVKPIEFALVSPHFYRDQGCQIPATCGGLEGESLTLVFSVIGENQSVDQHSFDVHTKIVGVDGDEDGQISGTVEMGPRPQRQIDMKMHVNLNRLPYSGTYSIHCRVTERSTGKTATQVLPLVVVDPFASND
jgi:hypothetical protein